MDISRQLVKLGSGRIRFPIRVLHLSDLHASEVVGLGYIRQAIQTGLKLKPDLICLTGDLITLQYEALDRYVEVLTLLSQCAPTFACLGNHDGGLWASRHQGYQDTKWVRELLGRSGIELLFNAAKSIQIHQQGLNLVGLGDLWADELSPHLAFPGRRPATDSFTLVLSHNPDSKEQLPFYLWDLLLCGHTHGGQCRLPLVGTPFAPVRDKRFVEGLYPWRGRQIHITKGIGNVLGLRFNCRPEISLLTLV